MATNRDKFAINEPFYQWSVRAFSVVHKRVGMKIAVHTASDVLEKGQIFLFNHFARFETLIPQYFIYQATGAYCRCVATHELFESSERFAKVLWGVGAVPSNHPGLLAFLAAEILRGQKVIFFPEGSMMKDRSIAAPPSTGLLSSLRGRVRHRQGAAALAVVLELYKKRILSVHEAGDTGRLDRWVAALGLRDRGTLIEAARKPTLVVPSNITFHPIHRGENFLLKAVEFLKFNLGQRGREELMVEGNLILRQTDMDIRFGSPLHPDMAWSAADRLMLARAFEEVGSLDDLFGLTQRADHWVDKLAATSVRRAIGRLRDQGMVEMYANVTLNLSHLAARIMMQLASKGETTIDKQRFHAMLYAVLKAVQKEPGLHLHRTLSDPNEYGGLPFAAPAALEKFYETAVEAGLIAEDGTQITLLPALLSETEGTDPRLANAVRVYANEIESLSRVLQIVEAASPLAGPALANALFDDEQRANAIDQARHRVETGLGEPAKRDGSPFLLMPEKVTKAGVVLVHGFLASPAQVRNFGEKLRAAGHPVLGVRLKGHGTSPHDLRLRNHAEWLGSVARGYEIMALLSQQVLIVGFATGASLALLLASQRPKQLGFVASISAPVEFRMPGMRTVPLLHRINRLTQLAYMPNGIKPFRERDSEHPDIEYRNMPVQALVEVRRVAEMLQRRLADVACPVMIVQGSNDPVIAPGSAKLIEERLGSLEKTLHIVTSSRHGILHDDIGGTHELLIGRLAQFAVAEESVQPAPSMKLVPRIRVRLAAVFSAVGSLRAYGSGR